MYTDNKKKQLYRRTEKHTIFVDYIENGHYQYARCTGCAWEYHPTEYEKKWANPILNVLDYHHWIDHLEGRN